MRNLQIIGNVPQVRRESNFGEYAEEATIIEEQPKVKKENPHFLEANTLEVTMQHLKEDCVSPVFAKDNELTIPHPAFIDTVYDAANTFFSGESIDKPDIRVSHIIKGRIPEAIHKPANQLLESDKTIYYERCAFIIRIPTIQRKEQKGLRYLLALLVKFVQTCVYQQTVFLVVWKLLIPKIYIGQYWKCFRVINLQNIYICCKHLVTQISQNINFANYLVE